MNTSHSLTGSLLFRERNKFESVLTEPGTEFVLVNSVHAGGSCFYFLGPAVSRFEYVCPKNMFHLTADTFNHQQDLEHDSTFLL